MLVMHTLALPSLLSSAVSASVTEQLALVPRIAGLSLSAVFFALKFLDVHWLRAKQDWRRAVAAVLIVGLLHVGTVDRALAGSTDVDSTRIPCLFAGVLLGTVVLIRRLVAELSIRNPEGTVQFVPVLAIADAMHRAWRPHQYNSHLQWAAPRAPPV